MFFEEDSIIMLLFMSRKGLFFGCVFCVLVCANMSAQEAKLAKPQILIDLAENDGHGQIELTQPVQVENLLKLKIANNRMQKGIHGYRIQIFSQSGQPAKQKSDEARMNFMKNFPELEAHQEYNAPYWQISVGDFRTKNETLREIKRIEKMFPRAFIVSEIINIPK